MIIKPYNGAFFLLLLLTISAIIVLKSALKKKTQNQRRRILLFLCLCNIILFFGYKFALSLDSGYIMEYYKGRFVWLNELPLHLCNINLFLIPIGMLQRNRKIISFSFFVAPLGALMALIFPMVLFADCSLFIPRVLGYYVTHCILIICGISLTALKFYSPKFSDIPHVLMLFLLMGATVHVVNMIVRHTVHPEANYFFTYGSEASILKFFWQLIPLPLIYALPILLILAGYMSMICGLFRILGSRKQTPALRK